MVQHSHAKNKPEPYDIWNIFQRSVDANPLTPLKPISATTTTTQREYTKWDKINNTVSFLLLDITGSFLWLYLSLKLFVLDIDKLFSPSSSYADFLINKIIYLLVITFVIAVFFWKWRTLFAVTYILIFPAIIVFWKIPKLVVKLKIHKSWVFWMVLINSLVNFVRSFRYHVISKSLSFLSIIFILITNNIVVLFVCAAILIVTLTWSIIRQVLSTFRPSWFFQSQTKFLNVFRDLVIKNPIAEVKKLVTFEDEKGNPKLLAGQELQNLAMQIQFGIIGTRVLYLWAYKLQQYRQLQLIMLFNLLAYMYLIFGSIITLTAINLAVIKIDPTQYSLSKTPSIVAVVLYSLSNFVLNDGGGIIANGDVSYIIRIFAGAYGLFFIAVFLVNMLVTFRSTKDEIELKESVSALRKLAKSQEEEFNQILKVKFEEAFRRLSVLGLGGLSFIYNFVVNIVPEDYYYEN